MIHDETMGAVLASAGELAAAAGAKGWAFGDLAPAWLADAEAGGDAGGSLSEDGALLLDAALHALADPARLVTGRATVADAVLRSFTLAWDRERDIVAMAGSGPEGIALTALAPEQAFAFMAGAVGLAGPMDASLYRPALSARATLALVATADAFRAATMRAALLHAVPSGSVSIDEIAQAIADAVTADARWLVPFLAGVLPFGVEDVLPVGAVDAALTELADAGAVTLLEGDGGVPTLVELTDAGAVHVDGLVHDSGRLALTITEVADGAIAWETILLVRSADGLWLADLTAGGGSVAGLARDEAARLLGTVAGMPEPVAETDAVAPDAMAREGASDPSRSELTVVACPHCGAPAYREYGECPQCRGRFS